MHWTLNPVGGPWTVAILAVVLLAVCAIPPGMAVGRGRRATLVAMRIAAVLLVILAMLRPEAVRTRTQLLRAALPILVDSSRSMTVEDSLGGQSRWAAAMGLLEDSAESLEKLGQTNDIGYYYFDRTLHTAANINRLRQVTPDGDGTALGMALDELLRNEAAERLLGVILLSDGAQRATPPGDLAPQVAARRYALEGAPLFPFAFGTPTGGDRADVAMDDLLASGSVFADTPTQVSGQLRVRGYANRDLTVQLLWEDDNGELQVVDSTTVQALPAAGQQPVVLRHTPKLLGERKVQLRVLAPEGEVLTSNNAQSTFVTVREGGINVLYLAGATRPGGGPGVEQRFTRAALAASPDISVTRRLVDYEPPQADLRQQIEDPKWDVFVLDDLDAQGLSRQSWQSLADRVTTGAGMIMTGGYHSFGPGGHGATPMGGVLPVAPSKLERQPFGEPLRRDVHLQGPVKMLPTQPLGLRHPVMQIGPDPIALWRELPPLVGANQFNRRRLKRNAVVLAEADLPNKPPVLVAGQPGRGRVLAFAGDSTWKWQMAGQGEAHRRYWRQAILWLAQQDDNRQNPVWLELAARRVARGGSLKVTAGANPPEQGGPVELELQLQQPSGDILPVDLSPAGDQRQAVLRAIDTAGDYTVTVTGRQGQQVIGQSTARFTVPPTDVELDRPAAEPGVMAQLAQITEQAGGRTLAPEELPDLLAELAARKPQAQEEVVERITYWDTWPFFLLLVLLLGAEWYQRKRWGLV